MYPGGMCNNNFSNQSIEQMKIQYYDGHVIFQLIFITHEIITISTFFQAIHEACASFHLIKPYSLTGFLRSEV